MRARRDGRRDTTAAGRNRWPAAPVAARETLEPLRQEVDAGRVCSGAGILLLGPANGMPIFSRPRTRKCGELLAKARPGKTGRFFLGMRKGRKRYR